MSSSLKRPWFRFHLLTAVLMMATAGGMLWMNSCRRFTLNPDLPPYFAHFGWIDRGWPMTAYRVEAGLIREQDYTARAESDPDLRARMTNGKISSRLKMHITCTARALWRRFTEGIRYSNRALRLTSWLRSAV